MSLEPEESKFIQEEEQVVKDTNSSISRQREKIQQRFQIESGRARELTSELVGTRRAEEKVQIASDEAISHALTDLKVSEFETIDHLLESPYFARFKVEEEVSGATKEYEYKLGHHSNIECRIIDWRKAPIAKLYYEYREGDHYSEIIQDRDREGIVTLRNSVEIEKGELKQISCRHGRFSKRNGVWEKVSSTQRSSKSSADGLPSILSLITPDQFRMITEEASTAVLIQGIAGSGKTTVALHRLAWLLHEDNSDLKPHESLILVYSNALKSYVSQTLPSMKVTGVSVLTFSEWSIKMLQNGLKLGGFEAELKRPATRVSTSIVRLKGSLALLCALEEYVEAQIERVLTHLESCLPWDSIPTGIKGLLDQYRGKLSKDKRSPIINFLKELSDGLARGASLPPTHPRAAGIAKAREIVTSVTRRVSLYREDLALILENPQAILKHDETKLLDSSLIAESAKIARTNFEQNLVDPSDDALLLYLFILKNGGISPQGNSISRFRHIVLDEVQDFSPTALACVVGSVENRSQLTLVGDSAQEFSGSFPGWEKLKRHWKLDEEVSKFISLSVSHRSTLPIMRFADATLGEQRTTQGREGTLPFWCKVKNEREAIEFAIEWLLQDRSDNPNSISAVICGNKEEAKYIHSLLTPTFGGSVRLGDEDSFSFDSGILVTEVRQVKGLEFYSVLLWNPLERNYPDTDLGRNLLYVAITRAEERLVLLQIGERVTPLLRRAEKFARVDL